jgi:SHS2 domain-containing protein
LRPELLEKQQLDVIANPNTEAVLAVQGKQPEIVLYGVVTEICVACAARGLLDRGHRLTVVRNAIHHLDGSMANAMLAEIEHRVGKIASTWEVLKEHNGCEWNRQWVASMLSPVRAHVATVEVRRIRSIQEFEEVEHAADRAFRARGHGVEELFANAAHALFSLEGTSPAGAGDVTREVQVEGADRETLLVNWLNELLYLEQRNREAYDRIKILEIDDSHLRAPRTRAAPEGSADAHQSCDLSQSQD